MPEKKRARAESKQTESQIAKEDKLSFFLFFFSFLSWRSLTTEEGSGAGRLGELLLVTARGRTSVPCAYTGRRAAELCTRFSSRSDPDVSSENVKIPSLAVWGMRALHDVSLGIVSSKYVNMVHNIRRNHTAY